MYKIMIKILSFSYYLGGMLDSIVRWLVQIPLWASGDVLCCVHDQDTLPPLPQSPSRKWVPAYDES